MINKAIDPEQVSDLEDAVILVDTLLAPRQLTPVQELVFKQTWLGRTYQEMAEGSSYTTDYIRITGSQLWQSLSQVIGRKVTKSNLRISFKHHNARAQGTSRSPVGAPRLYQPRSQPDSAVPSPGYDNGHLWQPPLQAVELELPVGQVPLGSTLYVERTAIESRCYAAIHQPGALLRIKGVKQSGKTSLMARLLNHAQQSDFATVALNMRQIGLESLENIDAFLSCFCTTVTRQLNLPNRFGQYRDDICSPLANSTDYLEHYLLPEIQSPLVIALDDVDILFDYPMVAANFLGLLRAWYERSRYGISGSKLWENLRLIVVHSADAVLPLTMHQSPFNVGLSIKLPNFELSHLQYLAQRHGLEWLQDNNNEHLRALLAYLGGNPYRLRLAFYHLAHGDISLSRLLKSGLTGETSVYHDHLNQQWIRLQRHPDLREAYAQVIHSNCPVALNYRIASDLHNMGFVTSTSHGAEPSCQLYQDFFYQQLSNRSVVASPDGTTTAAHSSAEAAANGRSNTPITDAG
ncbi:MAG: AAA-like domain-containing protein [Elainellaceae cyanobacterium]